MDEIAEIWKYGRGYYKGYSDNINIAKRVKNWNSVESCSIYYTPLMQIFAYDFIFPTRTYSRVARLLGLPDRKKSPSKILQGQRLQLTGRIAQVKSSELIAVDD